MVDKNMNNVKVSVIVPVFKVEKYLAQCIESLLQQTLKDIEIILVDDGSPDNSGAICDKYAVNDSRIVVIHKENEGVSVARNAGIDKAHGEWITFVDGDDWVDCNLCKYTYEIAKENNADVIICSYYSAYPSKNVKAKLLDLPELDATDKKQYIQAKIISQYYDDKVFNNGVSAGTSWCKLIKRSVIQNNNIRFVPGLVRAQDTVFWLNAFNYVEKILYIDFPLYYYRISDTSIVSGSKYIPDCDIPFGALLAEYRKFIENNDYELELKKAYYSRCIQVLTWKLKHYVFHKDFQGNHKERMRLFREICNSKEYSTAIKKVETKNLPKRLKALVYCCRFGMYSLYYKIYTIQNNKR